MSREIKRNKYDKKDSLEMSLSSSSLFIRAGTARGWQFSKSTEEQDINEHWDYQIHKKENNQTYSYLVELKAQKRISRKDDIPQDDWTWIELHSVRPYDKGWLLNSRAKYICFERNDCFEFYDRILLLERVFQLIDLRTWAENAENAQYVLYDRRKNNTDILTLIEFSKIYDLCCGIWPKG
jgi:hypothetical protein